MPQKQINEIKKFAQPPPVIFVPRDGFAGEKKTIVCDKIIE